MRFYLDQNLSPVITAIASAQGMDVTDWQESGMEGRSDREQLDYAAREGRCIVTTDKVDFMLVDAQYRREGRSHAGILRLSRQVWPSEYSLFVAGLARFAAAYPEGLENVLLWFNYRLWTAM